MSWAQADAAAALLAGAWRRRRAGAGERRCWDLARVAGSVPAVVAEWVGATLAGPWMLGQLAEPAARAAAQLLQACPDACEALLLLVRDPDCVVVVVAVAGGRRGMQALCVAGGAREAGIFAARYAADRW